MRINQILTEGIKQRLDPKCWKGKHKEGTKIKGGVRVNNCVPNESVETDVEEGYGRYWCSTDKKWKTRQGPKQSRKTSEAANPAQQAAIAINMKKAGKQPKHENAEYDDEAGMADNNLETLERAVQGIDDLIHAGDNLPEWCQEKIAVAKSMLVAVWDYMASEEQANEMYETLDRFVETLAESHGADADTVWEDFESLTDSELFDSVMFAEDWQKVNKRDKTDGMSSKAVKAYRRENPGSKLKTAVTTKPSKLKKGSKSAKRRKSFCARMSGMKKAHASAKTKRDPNSPINKALRRWNC